LKIQELQRKATKLAREIKINMWKSISLQRHLSFRNNVDFLFVHWCQSLLITDGYFELFFSRLFVVRSKFVFTLSMAAIDVLPKFSQYRSQVEFSTSDW